MQWATMTEQQRLEFCRKYHNDPRVSYRDMGNMVGTTRNAIVSFTYRHILNPGYKKKTPTRTLILRALRPTPEPKPEPVLLDVDPVPLSELRRDQCNWPLWKSRSDPHRNCCARQVSLDSKFQWCDYHVSLGTNSRS